MTFIEAIKTGRPLNRVNKAWKARRSLMTYDIDLNILPGGFIDSHYFIDSVRLQIEDILADDWIVEGGVTPDDYETVG